MSVFVDGQRSAGRRTPVPPAARGLIRRAALFAQLSAARPGGVILVCAPAGSGKSVLIRSWLTAANLADRVAWVQVARGERDGQHFWLSLIDALGDVVASMEQPGPSPGFRGEAVVERLLSELGSLQETVVVVIDDLHELHSGEALEWLELFVSHLPSHVLVVLATREDPRLGLHRLRLAGELIELRGPDLAFSLEETRQLLRTAGVALSEAAVQLLYERTEGWAAGLRLAVISLAHNPDPERFVREFSGSERTVAGYLLAEVLERQPAEVRELLLYTSVLDRVSGPLADFMTGGSGSERVLQELEDANAFVSCVDARRTWFRYHHLFADLLQLELRRASPTLVGSLHRAAAQWYERHGYVVDAVRHAEAGRDWFQASRLLADNWFDLTLDGRIATVRELLNAVPEDVAAGDPELALVFAAVRVLAGRREQSAAYVDMAQRLTDRVPEERRLIFAVQLAMMRLVVARWRGDLDAVLEAMRSLETALAAQSSAERPVADEMMAVALENLGIAELWCSQFDHARRDLEQALELARRAGRPWLEIPCLGHLGIAGPWTGMPVSAGLKSSEEGVMIAEAHGWDEDPAVVTALAPGAMALLLMGRFDEAEGWLERAQGILQPDGEPAIELIVHYALGLLRLAQGSFEQALAAFREAARMEALLADVHPFAMLTRARLLQTQARMGDIAAARAALVALGDEERDTPRMRVAASVIELEAGRPEQAVDLLAPVIERSAPMVYPSFVLSEAQALDALARERLGDRRGAETSLEQALELAEPEGLVLPFILASVQDLLQRLPTHRTTHGALLRTIRAVLTGSPPARRGEPPALREELSDAELRVVRYLPSNLKAPEIAAELCVSANTVRTHIRHIYAKLDAHDRNSAVARARELGLLAPSSYAGGRRR